MVRSEITQETQIAEDRTVTIPEDVLREAGIHAGDTVMVRAKGPGCVEFETVDSFIRRYAGTFPYPDGYLEGLRAEWER